MKFVPGVNMVEVTRLTQQGKLAEAMAVLQGKAVPPAAAENANADDPGPFIEMAPPTTVSGAWTAVAPRDAKPRPYARGVRANEIPAGARFERFSYHGAEGNRDYKLYIPSTYAGKAVPLVVMLHGCTQNADDFAAGTQMNQWAEARGFLVAYPEQPQMANANRCWNWFSSTDQVRGRGEPAVIAGITREVMSRYNVVSGQVFVAGLSAGGALAAILGSTYPDLFAAIGVHSGLAAGAAHDMPSAFAAMRQGGKSKQTEASAGSTARAIVFHGDADQTVNAANADHVVHQFLADRRLTRASENGRSKAGRRYVKTTYSDSDGRAAIESWQLEGAGHAWAGGHHAGSFTDPKGIDASEAFVRFFLER